MARAMVSVVPPGDAPTKSLIGFVGKSSAPEPTTVAPTRMAAERTLIGRT
jgi:hypothetical protein